MGKNYPMNGLWCKLSAWTRQCWHICRRLVEEAARAVLRAKWKRPGRIWRSLGKRGASIRTARGTKTIRTGSRSLVVVLVGIRSHEESHIVSCDTRQRVLFNEWIACDGVPNCFWYRSFALAFRLPSDHRKSNEAICWPSRRAVRSHSHRR
jgi:hypothetical protein